MVLVNPDEVFLTGGGVETAASTLAVAAGEQQASALLQQQVQTLQREVDLLRGIGSINTPTLDHEAEASRGADGFTEDELVAISVLEEEKSRFNEACEEKEWQDASEARRQLQEILSCRDEEAEGERASLDGYMDELRARGEDMGLPISGVEFESLVDKLTTEERTGRDMGQRAVSAGMLMLGQSKDPKVVDALKEMQRLDELLERKAASAVPRKKRAALETPSSAGRRDSDGSSAASALTAPAAAPSSAPSAGATEAEQRTRRFVPPRGRLALSAADEARVQAILANVGADFDPEVVPLNPGEGYLPEAETQARLDSIEARLAEIATSDASDGLLPAERETQQPETVSASTRTVSADARGGKDDFLAEMKEQRAQQQKLARIRDSLADLQADGEGLPQSEGQRVLLECLLQSLRRKAETLTAE